MFLPVGLRLVSRLARSPRLLLLELFASFKFRVAALAGLLFSSFCTCLVSSGTAASRMFECGLALSGLGGCSPLGVLPPRFPLGCLLPLWVARAAAWGLASHFFPYLFLWSRCRSMVLGRDSAEVLPSGWFPLAVFLRVSCLRSGGGGFGWLSLAGPYVLRDVFPGACLLLSSPPLALHGVVSTSPVCLSRAPAFRQVRVAMLAEVPWNRPRSWCWLSIRLSSWWKGRLMGQRLVIVPLPWTAVFIHSVFS